MEEYQAVESAICKHPILHLFLANQFFQWKQFQTAQHYLLQSKSLLSSSQHEFMTIIHYQFALIHLLQHRFVEAKDNLMHMLQRATELDVFYCTKVIPLYYAIQLDISNDPSSTVRMYFFLLKHFPLKQALSVFPFATTPKLIRVGLQLLQLTSVVGIVCWLCGWLLQRGMSSAPTTARGKGRVYTKEAISVQKDPFATPSLFEEEERLPSVLPLSFEQVGKWKQVAHSSNQQQVSKNQNHVMDEKQVQEQVMKRGYFGQMVQLSSHSSTIFDYFAAARQ